VVKATYLRGVCIFEHGALFGDPRGREVTAKSKT